MRLSTFLLAGLPLLGQAAVPPAHPYADATRRRIATAQDERQTATLLPFLQSKNAAYRAAAAEALASVQDKKAVPALLPLLQDASPAVRRAAAYALGQTGDSTAVSALAQRLAQPEASPLARRATYEALGRCVTKASVSQLYTLKPPGPDSAAAPGQAWALYRASLRGLATPEVARQAVLLLGQPGPKLAPARAGASAALTRMRGQDSVLARMALPVLLKAVGSDPDYFVRENCASALGRVARPVALAALLAAGTKDPDHRVRIAALRALPTNPITVVSATRRPGKAANEVILQVKTREADSLRVRCAGRALGARLPQESLTAAEWFLKTPHDTTNSDNVMDWLRYVVGIEYSATAARHWRTRATLLQAALRHARAEQRSAIADTIRRRYERTSNQYERAALLTALSEDPAQFDFLAKEAALTTGPTVVPGSAVAALVSLRGNKRFPAARQADFTAVLRRALAGGDVAQLATAAEALASPILVPAPQPEDLAALRQAQSKLTLPREIEAWLSLQQALDKLEKRPAPTPAPVGPASQHPIAWAVVQSIPVGQRVQMTTTKGVIILELKVVEAPGSVVSFVSLIRQHFYDGLYFHRVVPDFVAQGGDPRGDGSGSTPYNLRSEFSQLTYGAGAVGLASAGKDTESCQFFFTHQPTPHLDGRYTIFAQVVQGMGVVQQLEIGDRMLRVELLKAAR
ncbi:peptidylprolyl isomerase [Hymenobacter ginsengisoli]|uniref:peptidylprolyl isomerase n=1 Tax=Hymenobacter ginsengisoli TaxID=1051626 RepID=A0ABP8QQY1_9BACT|nr:MULTISPECIES: peptidylprolyl isomerase [unclassified Hymenobacter]MBO2032295.1 peptidylprolyl isomerase [Hymenobacter sp. BT559]